MTFLGEQKIVWFSCVVFIPESVSVNDSKIKASAELFVKGNLSSEQMKAKLRFMKRLEDEEAKTRDEIEAYFENFRTGVLILWVVSNGEYFQQCDFCLNDFCAVLLIEIMTDYFTRFNYDVFWYYTISIFVLGAFSIGIRTVGSVIYLLQEVVFNACFRVEVPRFPSGPRQHYPIQNR
jgi:hypothetical protein